MKIENWSFQTQLDSPERLGVRSTRGAHEKGEKAGRCRQAPVAIDSGCMDTLIKDAKFFSRQARLQLSTGMCSSRYKQLNPSTGDPKKSWVTQSVDRPLRAIDS